MARLFGTPKLVSVELFKVKNTLKHGRFSKFLKVTTKTEGHGKLEKLMEKIRVSPGIWRALNGTNSVKYFQFWENVIRKRKKSRTCFPAKTLSLTCKESYSNSKTQVMQWRIQGKPPPPPRRLIVTPNWGSWWQTPPPPPPPPHFRVWMTGPLPYLKVWICDCDVKAISNPFPLLCLCAKVTKIHTV